MTKRILNETACRWIEAHASPDQLAIIRLMCRDEEKILAYVGTISHEAVAELQRLGGAPLSMTASTAGFPDQLIHDQLVAGGQGRWRPLGEVAREEVEARLRKLISDNELVLAPDVEFEEDRELLWKAGLL